MMDLNLLAQTAAVRALNSVPEGMLIAATAWLVLKAFRDQSSRLRFAILFAAFWGIAGLPFAPEAVSPRHTMTGTSAEITFSSSWAPGFFICWLVIAGIRLARVVAGIWGLRRLRGNAVEVSPTELPTPVQHSWNDCKAVRKFTIHRSPDARVPMAMGFLKPAIVIPGWAFDELPAEDLNSVLLHEFAHLRRYDDWTNLAQKFIRAVFFFHPAVWWIDNKLALEREMACDELVLAETADRHAYATCLLSIAEKTAEKSFGRRGLAMAQTAITHARQTALRLARILNTERVVPTVFKPALAAGISLAALCLAALPHAPQLIAFRDSVPRQLASMNGRTLAPSLLGPARDRVLPASVATHATIYPASLKSAQLVPVKHQPFNRRPAVLVRTASRQLTAPESQVLIFVQTTEYVGLGQAKVNYCVWRLTVSNADRNTVRAEMIAKSI
jgi:beta-lactamase regulating signal transducer with metallopeptidase domain